MKEQKERMGGEQPSNLDNIPNIIISVKDGRVEVPVCLNPDALQKIAATLGLALPGEEVVEVDSGCVPKTLLVI